MITLILLALLGTALLAVLIAIFKSPRNPNRTIPAPQPPAPAPVPAPTAKPLELEAWDARRGDVVSLAGAAEDFSDMDIPIDRRNAYEASNRRWVGLEGDFRGRRVQIEVSRFPKSQVLAFTSPRELTIPDVGLSEEKLVDLDTRQDPSASIEFDKAVWHYESSREIAFVANETAQPVGLYRWTFNEHNGPRVLVIEKWEGEPFRVRLAQEVENRNITVYRAG